MDFRALTVAAVLLGWALPLRAQQPVTLQFNDGLVTLKAQNAPVRTILAEWARLGGATIVNGDHVAGPSVTLELAGVPERQALEIVLRSVAGYMLAPRQTGSRGASAFDRILILPTSVAPRNPPPAAVGSGAPRPTLSRPSAIARFPEAGAEAPAEAGQDDIAPAGAQDPAATQPRADGTRVIRPPFVMRPPTGVESTTTTADTPDDAEEPAEAPPAAVEPTPTNPFGIPFGSSATPGVVTPVPQPRQQQPRPRRTNRVQ